MNKIFGIGFHKTGTTTLQVALNMLGFTSCDIRHDLLASIKAGDFQPVRQVVAQYDAFVDNPWPIIYRQLDELYPNSKFILTWRDSQKWYQSCVKHFNSKKNPMREWIYGAGCPLGHEETYISVYEKHNREVLDYFRNRPNDLLVLNWENGSRWKALCDFLEVPVPPLGIPYLKNICDLLGLPTPAKRWFPHKNSQKSRIYKRVKRKLNP